MDRHLSNIVLGRKQEAGVAVRFRRSVSLCGTSTNNFLFFLECVWAVSLSCGLFSIMKRCKICNKEFPLEGFHISRKAKSGLVHYRNQCRTCHNSQKKDYKRSVADQVRKYKEVLCCVSCGYSAETHSDFTPKALEFHHHNSDKSFTIANAVGYGMSFENIKVEMDKCTVLCCRCHKEWHK